MWGPDGRLHLLKLLTPPFLFMGRPTPQTHANEPQMCGARSGSLGEEQEVPCAKQNGSCVLCIVFLQNTTQAQRKASVR